MKILLAEDEKNMNRLIKNCLIKEGYSVDGCFDGEEALSYIYAGDFDAIILDIMMPKINGLEVLKEIRNQGNHTPVIFLTAMDSIEDRVKGLDAGAEDYLVKPFALEELLARLRVMIRKQVGNSTNIFELSDLTVNINTRRVWRNGNEIKLTTKEYEILEYLIRNKDIVLSREKIENHIWNFEYGGGTNIIDVYIRYLRRKIDEPYSNKLIHTIKGAGYVMRDES